MKRKSMVIVESPAKARTIEKYLGRDFSVRASAGHIRDLPPKALGVDIKHSFRPTYRVIPGKEKVVEGLRRDAEKAGAIYLAADPDREGEAICFHLAALLEGKGDQEVYRVLFNEITKGAIQEAFKNPLHIDQHKVEAQQARRILDRIVGYKVSPLLWQKVRKGLSAGRVQTVAVRLIVDREREIRAFEPEEYWEFKAKLKGSNPPPFEAKASKYLGKKFKVANQEEADKLYAALQKSDFVVSALNRKERKRRPVPPFITSKLQQEAVRQLGFSVRKTMTLAQRLYEGVDMGSEGSVGLITYMRTDSTRVSQVALTEAREFIHERFGEKYLPAKAVQYQKGKGAQDAHEAIRPTAVLRDPQAVRPFLSRDEYRLYTLIWKRFLASQMTPALFDQTEILIDAGPAEFKAVGSILRFDGFLKLYRASEEDSGEKNDPSEEGMILPDLPVGEKLDVSKIFREQKFTQPPPRYNEASLVKALEEKGIGRPSTYQQILSVIMTRDYVTKEENRFLPTELGEVVNDQLIGHFDEIFDYDYTAKLEKDLDRIEEGSADWVKVLESFYDGFRERLDSARASMKNLRAEETPAGEQCEKCGSEMVIRWGRFGKFIACGNYPECKNTREYNSGAPNVANEESSDEITELCPKCGKGMVLRKGRYGTFLACSDYPGCRGTKRLVKVNGETVAQKEERLAETCPKCSANLVKKHGRYGEFVACSNYPECRFIKQNSTGVKCPKCAEGEVVEKKSKRGRVFYGCNRYPSCDFVLWQKPIASPCPECGASYVVEKTTKKSGTRRYCLEESCGYGEKMEDAELATSNK